MSYERNAYIRGNVQGAAAGAGSPSASSFLPQGFLLSQGLNMAGGLMKWLGSRGRRKEADKMVAGDRNSLRGMIGEKPYNPADIAHSTEVNARKRMQPFLRRNDAALGLDEGASGSDLINRLGVEGQGIYANATMRGDEMAFQNKRSILDRLLAGSEDYRRTV